jgi:hypothetical protein
MILRAVFWTAVVVVFLPQEPDVGYGRPDTGPVAALHNAIVSNIHRAAADIRSSDPSRGDDSVVKEAERIGRALHNAAAPLAGSLAHIAPGEGDAIARKINEMNALTDGTPPR